MSDGELKATSGPFLFPVLTLFFLHFLHATPSLVIRIGVAEADLNQPDSFSQRGDGIMTLWWVGPERDWIVPTQNHLST